MTVEHSLLTGASLHEPKGADSASAGEVYVADGLGSGDWSSLESFNAFGGQLLHVRDQRTSGSAPQTLTGNGTWEKRDLQTTLTNEITSATLTSSVISLPAGTYYIDATALSYTNHSILDSAANAFTKIRLRNTTDGADLVVGIGFRFDWGTTVTVGNVSTTGGLTVPLHLSGRFTLAGTKNIELQSYTLTNTGTRTGGSPLTSGSVEVYADVKIWKVS